MLRHQNMDNLPMGTAHSQLEAHIGSPIPDTHFTQHLTPLLHTRGRPFLLVHTRYKIGTFQQKPAKSHRRHNCGLQGSGLPTCSNKPAPTSSHHSLIRNHTCGKNLFSKKKKKKKKTIRAYFKVPHATYTLLSMT